MNARTWNRCSRRRPSPRQRSAAFTPLQFANAARLPMNSNIQPDHKLKRRERLNITHTSCHSEIVEFPRVTFETSIPKGLRNKAQGCQPSEVLLTKEGEATLGKGTEENSTPTGLRHSARLGDNHAGVAGTRASIDPSVSNQNASLRPVCSL